LIRVLMFGWELPPTISGGLGTACYGLCKALALSKELSISFVLPREIMDEHISFVKLISIPACSSGTDSLPKPYGLNMLNAVQAYADRVETEINCLTPFDIIHVHDWLTLPAGLKAKSILRKPLVFHIHSTEFDRALQPDPNIISIEREGVIKADLVVAVSEKTRNTLIKYYDVPENKVVVIHNGIDILKEKMLPKAEKKLISFIGRITHQKGPEYFLKAAAIAAKSLSGYRFVLAGDGDLFMDMQKLGDSLGIGHLLVFPGFLQGREISHLLARTAVYVMPSVSEPFGIGALEAVAAEVPVIVSRQAGVVEVIKNISPVDYWDVNSIAREMVKLATDTARSNEISAAAKKELLGKGWETAASLCQSAYIKILDKVNVKNFPAIKLNFDVKNAA